MSSIAPHPVQSRRVETAEENAWGQEVAREGKLLRLLRVIYTLGRESGGPAESVLRSSAALRQMGHEVEVVTADPLETPAPVGAGFPFHPLGGAGAATLGYWLHENRERFDAVIVQGLWQVGHIVRCALRGSRVPYFVFPHGMLDPSFVRSYPLKHIKKQIYWWWREGRVLRDAAAVCFTSQEERKGARRTFFPYTVNERVVAYGTAKPPSESEHQKMMLSVFLERFPALRGKAFLLFLGRIHQKKGLHELIEGFAKFCEKNGTAPIPYLVIAGPCADPNLLRTLMRQAERLGLTQCNLREGECYDTESSALTWLPMLGDELKWGALLASEAFILPSHQENFGIAVAEALACARPVLISDKVNIWREIEEARAGIVAADTVDGVYKLLSRWGGLSTEERLTMRTAAIACFEKNFEINRAAASLVQTILKCLT